LLANAVGQAYLWYLTHRGSRASALLKFRAFAHDFELVPRLL
jgi:hypothetical protein